MSRARDWARRAALSALAGGGVTAAGIGGPLSGGGALAAEAQPGGLAPDPPPKSTAPAAPAPGAGQTTTATTTAGATPPPGESSTAPGLAPAGATKQPSTGSKPRPHGPAVVVQRKQPATGGTPSTPGSKTAPAPSAAHKPAGPTVAPSANIAPAPQLAAGQLSTAAPLLPGSLVSMQALGFYRIPLFLLPIYQAAAAQYGVPWQILAAINEVETDYGSDLSVSTAGAVGWMQFMPETWLQYGVDAVNAGYADPYNPVDAIFAAARYLHAAGASGDLHAAIFAYNHSEAYVQSVLLRARLIASYPASVIATLTGLTEGSPPVAGAKLAGPPAAPSSASATAGATAQSGSPASAAQATAAGSAPAPVASASLPGSAPAASASLPGSTPAPAPALSAVSAERLANAPSPFSQLSELVAAADAPVVAVEDGRIVGLGRSHRLGNYLVLRDTYGDLFTYAGLGSIVPSYRPLPPAQLQVPTGALRGGEAQINPAPLHPASAGRQLPLTLHVAAKQAPKRPAASRKLQAATPATPDAAAGGAGKVRVFAHPGNPDALAAVRAQAARAKVPAAGWTALARGSLVAQGTLLGHLRSSGKTSRYGYLRFAIRPPGAQDAIDPGPVLENWRQLDAALHPQGAKAGAVLAGATAGGAFLLRGGDLERAVLSDPEVRLGACDRHQIASGKVDDRMLALLVFLSRSGLKPTVGELRCGRVARAARGAIAAHPPGDALKIGAINGVPIAGHQGAGTITDVAIRTLLTAKHPFAPSQIVSLMQYPGAPSTVARADHASYIEIELPPKATARVLHGAAALAGARSAGAHAGAAAIPGAMPAAGPLLDSAQWRQLIARIGGLPNPRVTRRPSGAAIRDPQVPAAKGTH